MITAGSTTPRQLEWLKTAAYQDWLLFYSASLHQRSTRLILKKSNRLDQPKILTYFISCSNSWFTVLVVRNC